MPMAIEAKKREGESVGSLIYRFTKKVQQSGVLREAKKRKFRTRDENRNKRRVSALMRNQKKQEFLKKKKMGEF